MKTFARIPSEMETKKKNQTNVNFYLSDKFWKKKKNNNSRTSGHTKTPFIAQQFF
jgi:uncharacterized membrane protein